MVLDCYVEEASSCVARRVQRLLGGLGEAAVLAVCDLPRELEAVMGRPLLHGRLSSTACTNFPG